MKKTSFATRFQVVSALCVFLVFGASSQSLVGHSEITKWQYGKRGAVSITYDDGSINQFRVAVPIMNRLGIPGTFFINTGTLPGSKHQSKFIGRDINKILEETKTTPTNIDNVFERASAARFVNVRGADDYFTRAGAQIDAGRMEPAYKILDEFFEKLAKGELEPVTPRSGNNANRDVLTWDMVRQHTAEGHEFASHLVSHPYVSALDVPNLMYELEKSKDEMLRQVGIRATFSAECPYGSEDERAMGYALKVYEALRNVIHKPYLLELNRGSRRSPINADYEYVQWQRGILTRTTLDQMKAWTDTTAMQDNMWLVLVIHGIDGIGWEAMTGADVDTYFSYIKSKDNDLWVATFGDAARYMKGRMATTISTSQKKDKFVVTLKNSLNKKLYDIPLTIKTYVDPAWREVSVKQGKEIIRAKVARDGANAYVMYQAMPGKGKVELAEVK